MFTQTLEVLGRGIHLEVEDPELAALFEAAYGGLAGSPDSVDLQYVVSGSKSARSLSLWRDGTALSEAADEGELLWQFDGDLAVEIQKLRSDLYFVHAAALRSRAGAILLVGDVAAGKSTACWALTHHGFDYLSDELAPIDSESLSVHAFPRSVILKKEPPNGYPVPEVVMRTTRGICLPMEVLPSSVVTDCVTLSAIFFLSYDEGTKAPYARPVSAAEAATRLYANTLNALAHPASGLDTAIRIASGSDGFELIAGDLATTCRVLEECLAR